MESVASGKPAQRLEFVYDDQSRRTGKKVFVWSVDHWSLTCDRRFLYDGWNLMTELSSPTTDLRSPPSVLHSYLWGLDLSGSLRGTGGTGGLLFVTNAKDATGVVVVYDGNGNVAGLIDSETSKPIATYWYGLFGEAIQATRPLATVNPFQFSTKYRDEETGLLYYGYRFYDASNGKWISRDPIEEKGGLNLYGFVSNAPVSKWDELGLLFGCSCTCQSVTVSFIPGGTTFQWGLIAAYPPEGRYKYGNVMTVKWTVSGNPKKCTYAQRESGSVTMIHLDGPGSRYGEWLYLVVVPTHGTYTSNPPGKSYEDWIGPFFNAPGDTGHWAGNHSALSIILECTSSDGTVSQAPAVNMPAGTLDFWVPSS